MRYPVVASEILGCEDDTIEKALLSSGQVNRFFEFFAGPASVLLSGVVVKVLLPLFDTQYIEMMKKLKANPKWIDNMLNNLQCPSVCEFVVKLVQENHEKTGAQDWLIEIDLVKTLYSKFSKANEKQHSDACTLVSEVLESLHWDSSLVQNFATQKSLSALIGHTFEPGNDSGFKAGVKILTKLLTRMGLWMKEADQDEEDEEVKSTMEKPDLHGSIDTLPPLIQEVVKILPKYPGLLKNPPQVPKIKDQSGRTNEVFGFHRLVILENITALLSLGFSAVVTKLLETDILNVSWDLLFKFDANPFCHRNVEKNTSVALELVGAETQIKILKETNLVTRLIQAEADNAKDEEAKKPRRAYMPFLHQAGAMLQIVGATNETVLQFMNAIPGWTKLSETLDAEKKKMEELF